MKTSRIGAERISYLGVGTKRCPMQDSTRVNRVDAEQAYRIFDAACEAGVGYVSTSYSAGKGEMESVIGDYLHREEPKSSADLLAPGAFAAGDEDTAASGETAQRLSVVSGYFEMIDPRYDYVFNKQLKKLRRDRIEFYHVEGAGDITWRRDIDSGAVDYLFARKEEGAIGNLGFSSEFDGDALQSMLDARPWDFVRMRLNFYDWFLGSARRGYETAVEAGVPIIAHGTMRTGPARALKPAAASILAQAHPGWTYARWAASFIRSLPGVVSYSVNVTNAEQMREAAQACLGAKPLSSADWEALELAASQQCVIRPVRSARSIESLPVLGG